MIDTQLILIEGLPGSGKSTTAENLASEIKTHGKRCHCFLEWAENHPIFIGSEKDMAEIISSSPLREPAFVEKWEAFSKGVPSEGTVNIIESRFWQTGVMFLYAAGQTENEIISCHQRIIRAIEVSKPVLIYFTHDNTRQAFLRTFQNRNQEWENFVLGIAQQQQRAKDRGLKGREMWFKFFEEWVLVAERLYNEFPFPKIKIPNPHEDWNLEGV